MPRKLNFPTKKINERMAEIFIPTEGKISKKLPVFYNPKMVLNRDITILLLKLFPPLNLCDPLAGTGIRAIRFAKELKYKSITANDLGEKSAALIKKNMKHNKVRFDVINKDANLMLLDSNGFDFIDLDVFGCPNFLLDSSINRLSRDGILAVTATDTAALCGTYPRACKRKYWAIPLLNEEKHEIGLRILTRKIQLVAAQYGKALTPIFSYSKDHYMRTFLVCKKSKEAVDIVLKQHALYKEAGPLWIGQLWNPKLVKTMLEKNTQEENTDFLNLIQNEASTDNVGFHDMHTICKKAKAKTVPKIEMVIQRIRNAKFEATRTHFLPTAIKTNMPGSKVTNIILAGDN